MFEKATRLKLRFDSPKGLLTVEDLWDLPLTAPNTKANLDDIAKGLYREIKDSGEMSFVNETSAKDERLQLAFEIVKKVIAVKKLEQETRVKAKENAEKKQKILAIIADREDEALRGQSLEDLKAMVDQLN